MRDSIKSVREMLNHYVGLISLITVTIVIPFVIYVYNSFGEVKVRVSVLETEIQYIKDEKKNSNVLVAKLMENMQDTNLKVQSNSQNLGFVNQRVQTIERMLAKFDSGDLHVDLRLKNLKGIGE